MAKLNTKGHIKPQDLFHGVLHLDTQISVVQSKQDAFIEHQHVFNAVLLPIVLWLGRNNTDTIINKTDWINRDVRDLFGLTSQEDNFLISFIEQESLKMFRFNSEGNHVGYLSPMQYLSTIHAGCILVKQLFPGMTLVQIRDQFTAELLPFNKEIHFSKIGRYLLNGRPDQLWYRATYAELCALLPMIDPQVLFHLMAGTSMNAQLQSNIKLFFKALAQYYGKGKVLTYNSAVAKEINTQFSGFLPAAIYQLDHFVEHGKLRGRKISNFAQAMLHDLDAVVVDIWIMRAFGADRKYVFRNQAEKSRSPEKRLYDVIEYYIQRMARVIRLEPREFCSMIWGGVRIEETGTGNKTRYTPFIGKYLHFNDMFLHPNEIYFGEDGIHFGTDATQEYHRKYNKK
ncbi:MAG: hypothetical protein WCG20_03620 [bacterium]